MCPDPEWQYAREQLRIIWAYGSPPSRTGEGGLVFRRSRVSDCCFDIADGVSAPSAAVSGALPALCKLTVLLLGSHSASDVTFLFVQFKNAPDLCEQSRIFFSEPFAYILMNSAFGYSESLGSISDCSLVLYYVLTEQDCSLSGLDLHNITPDLVRSEGASVMIADTNLYADSSVIIQK